jgi:hypothetical protein
MMIMTPVRRLGEEGARTGALDHDSRADEQARPDDPADGDHHELTLVETLLQFR